MKRHALCENELVMGEPAHSKGETVAEVLLRHPAGTRVLERHRIDYCCGGQEPFRQACARAGIDAEALLAELSAVERHEVLPDWPALPLGALCDAIERIFHRPLRDEFVRLEALARKVRDVHGERHPELVDLYRRYAALMEELTNHMTKEERILFPMIRRIGKAPPPPIGVMMHEHEDAGAALEAMRKLTHDYAVPDDACHSYRALYVGLAALEQALHEHIHVENNILFPRALKGTGEHAWF